MNPTAVRQAEALLDAHVQHKPKGVSIFDDSEWSREWHRLYHLWILARWDANDAWVHAVWKSRERIVAGTTRKEQE